jgi:hypothetical protein
MQKRGLFTAQQNDCPVLQQRVSTHGFVSSSQVESAVRFARRPRPGVRLAVHKTKKPSESLISILSEGENPRMVSRGTTEQETERWSVMGEAALAIAAGDGTATVRTAVRLCLGRSVPVRTQNGPSMRATVIAARIFALGQTGLVYEVQLALDAPVTLNTAGPLKSSL